MRIIFVLCVVSSGLCGAAELPRVDSKDLLMNPRVNGSRAERDAAERAEIAPLVHGGLYLKHFQAVSLGWSHVTVVNQTDSPITFDFRQLRGVEFDSGNIVEAADVKFQIQEIASYSVGAKQEHTFRVFFAGHKIAAAAWRGSERWMLDSFSSGEVANSAAEALTLARKAAVAQRLAERKSKLRPVEPGTVPLVKK